MIGIDTTRYSTVIKAFIEHLPHATVKLEGKLEKRPMSEWCTNKCLCSTIDFSLLDDDKIVLSFHDHPRDLLADMSQLPFVETLANDKIIRFRICKEKEDRPGLLKRLFRKKAQP